MNESLIRVSMYYLKQFFLLTQSLSFKDDGKSIRIAETGEQLRRSAAFLLGVAVDVDLNGNITVNQNEDNIPENVSASLNSLDASDPSSVNYILKLKDDMNIYKSVEKIDQNTLDDIEAERAARVNALKSSLDNDTMVY